MRADLNHLIQENPGAFDGAQSPGELYRGRAKQHENLPPRLQLQHHLVLADYDRAAEDP